MRKRSYFPSLRWIFVYLFLGSSILATLQLVRYSRLRANFPPGMVIAGVPIGGLDRQQSTQRLLEVYTLPVEIRYGEAAIHLGPSVVGFQLDMDNMLAAAELPRRQQPFWVGFWNFLRGRPDASSQVPLKSSISRTRLRTYLNEKICARYDQPPTPALPVAGTVNFQPGTPGTMLDIDRSILLIEEALRSPSQRVVELPVERIDPPRASLQNLEILLKQTIDLSGFDGLTGLYLLDLQTAQEIHFAYRLGEDLPTKPDVAFTAASIIKIPIMVSAFRRVGENPDPETVKLLEDMIEKSGNDPADWLMERVIDSWRAPLVVAADMKALDLDNTFLAGQFYPGAPLLDIFRTPANQHPDLRR